MIVFEWDDNKNRINIVKHGVSFEESQTVFFDDNALLEFDEEHLTVEERFRILGTSFRGNVLIVVHCVRENDVIRIISSRKATNKETKAYKRRLKNE